jgi:hypothetical protein
MMDFWNERYSKTAYFYGETPNVFFAEQLSKLTPGNLVLPCEGEGRNAVFAAGLGWQVNAFDSSEAGKAKALQLAEKKSVVIDYLVEDAVSATYPENSVDVVAFIYAHFPAAIRKSIHQKAIGWLKPGGIIIMEAFNPKQLNNESGGPKDLSMLYTKEMLQDDFASMKVNMLETLQTELNEGKYHEGVADVIRFVGVKI